MDLTAEKVGLRPAESRREFQVLAAEVHVLGTLKPDTGCFTSKACRGGGHEVLSSYQEVM